MKLTNHSTIPIDSAEYFLPNWLVCTAILLVALTGCRSDQKLDVDVTPYIPTQNGLTEAERAEFYHLSEGADFIPLYIFEALEHADGGKFAHKIESYGFIYSSYEERGHELPIGISVEKSTTLGIDMVGLTCAACHVSDIHYKGQRIRIDGAPNTINVFPFYKDMLHAAERGFDNAGKVFEVFKKADHLKSDTRKILEKIPGLSVLEKGSPLASGVADVFKSIKKHETERLQKQYQENGREGHARSIFDAFEKDVAQIADHLSSLADLKHNDGGPLHLESREKSLDNLLHDYMVHIRLSWGHVEWVRKYAASNDIPGATPNGNGRVDAFGIARNLIFLDIDNYLPCNAPVSIPHLWGFKETKWLHWNANTNSAMQRNIIQALGTGAVLDPATLETTLVFKNLDRLDELAGKTTSPPWPIALLGPIDQEKARRGEIIYQENCASCHNASKTVDGLIEYPLFAPAGSDAAEDNRVDTDPGQAAGFDRTVNGMPFFEAVKSVAEKIEAAYYAKHNISEEQQKAWRGKYRQDVSWRSPLSQTNTQPPKQPVYPAKPLSGTWATAPYLHNGSVPNMYWLLKPHSARPKTFTVGAREYDPVNMGFDQTVRLDSTGTFDTTLIGNSAEGHEFGVDLSDEQRFELIEYLKTL